MPRCPPSTSSRSTRRRPWPTSRRPGTTAGTRPSSLCWRSSPGTRWSTRRATPSTARFIRDRPRRTWPARTLARCTRSPVRCSSRARNPGTCSRPSSSRSSRTLGTRGATPSRLPVLASCATTFPDPHIVHWQLHGKDYAESEQLPGVRIPCHPFLGTFGLAPSAELRTAATQREAARRRSRRPGPAPRRRGRRARRRLGGERGAAHRPAPRDRRQHRHQADHPGCDHAAAGLRRGRAGLDRGRALRAGRLRGLRHRDRDALAGPPPLQPAQGRGGANAASATSSSSATTTSPRRSSPPRSASTPPRASA